MSVVRKTSPTEVFMIEDHDECGLSYEWKDFMDD
ncbi:hypothetical protein PIIN_11298 [Serendipita indica DSM 11827]|uniref:Uncharacterized protein n=1 Tax=Serendipita indica (strain DSM 11827) TaxID=1109443 RepID=G4U177_SERID|nr:hypothetical protein PIIN_11298 [Serendipita indica DSM 11827]